jgi:4-amino-4-deoxy-L-arabinose transferase-like glycosyltransferase
VQTLRNKPAATRKGRGIVLQYAAKPISLPTQDVRATRWMDRSAIALLVLVGVVAVATFRDYGLGWDDYVQSQYGRLLLSLYGSGFTDKRALSYINLYMYGGGFDLLAALAAKISPFGLFATRRLLGAALGLIGLFVTWRLGRRLGGPLAGLIALILLATCPLYYGHMFINCKDAPFATAMMIALLGMVRAFGEYPRPTPATVVLCGIGIGLALGTRVLGGFAVLEALLPVLAILAARSRRIGLKPAVAECGRFLAPFVPAAILACVIMGLLWPWSVVEPLNLFRAVHYFSHEFETPWRELFNGRLIPINEMPRGYVPTLIGLQLPELMLVLGVCGLAGAIVGVARDRSSIVARRAALLAVVLAAGLPVLLTMSTQPYIYNGIRHLLFIIPPFAVLGGLAGAWIALKVQDLGRAAVAAAALALAVGTISPALDMVRLHPYEYTDFNHIVGGVSGARPLFMIDYWGLSLTQASQKLLAFLDERHEAPPQGQWSVMVCGPRWPVRIALGPEFKTSADAKGPDFAIALSEFYCAKPDAPLLFQIVRDGVVFARVYDTRGRSVPKLLTERGL